MLNCDICKKEIERRDIHQQITLPYEYSCNAFQNKKFDLCSSCTKKLNDMIIVAKFNFVNGEKQHESEENKT